MAGTDIALQDFISYGIIRGRTAGCVFLVKQKIKPSNKWRTMLLKECDFITIRGLVIPTNWDQKGNVVNIAIATFDEDEFIVEQNEKAEGLFKYIGEAVTVSGFLRKSNKKKIISITNLSIAV